MQRVLVDESLYDDFCTRLTAKVADLPTGSPWEDETVVGPLINEDAALRVESWIAETAAAGGRLLTGGERDGASIAPTLMADVPPDSKLACEEVFGPVMTIAPVSGRQGAFDAINASRFGLQAGLFTHDLHTAFAAHRELEVGGVVIGDVPSFRADQMPYGGEKSSGVGREGLAAAMDDLTHERVLVLTGLDL